MMLGYNDTGFLVAMTTRIQQDISHDNLDEFIDCPSNKVTMVWLPWQPFYKFLVVMATSLYSHKFRSTCIL